VRVVGAELTRSTIAERVATGVLTAGMPEVVRPVPPVVAPLAIHLHAGRLVRGGGLGEALVARGDQAEGSGLLDLAGLHLDQSGVPPVLATALGRGPKEEVGFLADGWFRGGRGCLGGGAALLRLRHRRQRKGDSVRRVGAALERFGENKTKAPAPS